MKRILVTNDDGVHSEGIEALTDARKRIIRLKQEEGLQARVRKRYNVTTDSDHDQPIADNLLGQDFTAERPNQRWVGERSELRIGEQGKAYLAVVLDLYSPRSRWR